MVTKTIVIIVMFVVDIKPCKGETYLLI